MATSLMRRNLSDAQDIFALQSRMWDWFTTPYGSTPLSKLFGESNNYIPPVDIWETPDEIMVVASMPGLNVETIDVQVLDNKLTLAGEQNAILQPKPEMKLVQHLRGIPNHGRFSFSFVLPCAVNPDNSHAKYEDGLLYVRFSKSDREKPVRIPVQGFVNNLTADPQVSVEQPRIS